jgi:hypothetical protein
MTMKRTTIVSAAVSILAVAGWLWANHGSAPKLATPSPQGTASTTQGEAIAAMRAEFEALQAQLQWQLEMSELRAQHANRSADASHVEAPGGEGHAHGPDGMHVEPDEAAGASESTPRENVRRRLEALESRLREEPEDVDTARWARGEIERNLDQLEVTGVEVTALDCAGDLCRVEFDFGSVTTQDAPIQALALSLPWDADFIYEAAPGTTDLVMLVERLDES